jgi:hypothetical protein
MGEHAAPPRGALFWLKPIGRPVVVMLLIAAMFHARWGRPIDALLSLGIAALAAQPAPPPDRRVVRRWPYAWPAAAAAAVIYGTTVGSWARYSWPTTIAVLGLGLVVIPISHRWPPRAKPPLPLVPATGVRAWAAVWLGLCAWEVIAFAHQPSRTEGSYDHPTLSVLSDSVLGTHLGRSIVLAAWVMAGWGLARR